MVAVLVSDQQAVQVLPGDANSVKAGGQFPGGETGIDQQTALSTLNIQGVALASAGQQTNPQNLYSSTPPESAVYIPEI
jgi:hypothetical protein